MKKKVFFSIIIPVKRKFDLNLLNSTLSSFQKQTFSDFEIIIVTDKQSGHEIKKIIKNNTKSKLVIADATKSQARNIGAKNASGKYFIHIDIDNFLFPNTLLKTHSLILRKGVKTVILNEKIKESGSIWHRARKLEREIALNDPTMSSPQVIEKKLFFDLGGFDQDVDALDDWSLALKLKKRGIDSPSLESATMIHEPVNFFEVFSHRIYKGRFVPTIQKKYGQVPQLSFALRLKAYKDSSDKIKTQPHIFAALLVLKISDFIPFAIGAVYPMKPEPATLDIYKNHVIAESFDSENVRTYKALYKNNIEQSAILQMIKDINKKDTFVELGCGTGRITNILINKGYNVTPTDTSEAMLKILKRKNIKNSILIKNSSKLPFKNKSFDHLISIRVIWHILNREKRENFLLEAIRISKKSIIIDFTNDSKYKMPFIKKIIGLVNSDYFINSYYYNINEIKNIAANNNLKIEEIENLEILPALPIPINIPNYLLNKLFTLNRIFEKVFGRFLPPGRFLVKFTFIK